MTIYPLIQLLLAMKILDPHLRDGVHEWRDGKRFVKEGDRLYLEGTDTLAGRQAQILVSRSFHHGYLPVCAQRCNT